MPLENTTVAEITPGIGPILREKHLVIADRGGFDRRPLVQWPTRPMGGWALEAPRPRGPRKA